jgi:tetratricopeptide (TPR) repeat protein
MVLLEMENARESVKYLQRARSLEPRRPDVAFNLVRAELAAGDWPAARDEARNSAHTFAGDAGWYGSVGKLFLESGHAQDAALLLRDALRLSASEEVRRLLASAYLQTQQPDLVLSLIPEPKTPDERFLCGSALLIKHHLAEAESEAAKLLEMAPNEARYLLLAARIQQFQGHQDQALELLRRAAGNAPRWAEPYYCMAVSYYFEHRYDDARRALNESLQRSSNSSRSLFLFAVTLINQGKNREAEAYLRRAIAIQPDNARYRVHLGAALLRDDRPAEAQEAFRQAIRLKPDYALPHCELGKLLAQSGHPHDALPELETAIQYEPGLVQAYYQLSRVAAALGQREKSSQALATFNRLKKQETDEQQGLSDDVNGELQHP